MTPVPQENVQPATSVPPQDGNRIVISGMSGLYPRSHNVKEFSDILYNKVNPVTSTDLRFKYNHPEVVQYTGTIPELNLFDAQFFKVHFRLASAMDPMGKKVLEQSYQAIYDAGINPEELSGKKVGVFIGSCFSEADKTLFYSDTIKSGFGIPGCSKTMFPNRISYWLNAKGPSMAIDAACCSSTSALEQACLAISRGDCESAIVGGSYLCLHPQSSIHYSRIIKMCKDGKTKSFDEHANGCARSEAVNILFLQKAKDALRVYAEVIHAQAIFTCNLKGVTGQTYGFYRDLDKTVDFMKKFYEEAKVSPQSIEYVEAFGSGSPEADKVELQAIEEVFCEDRQDPLLVGSVMSNIGYGEAASGISAITKVLLGFHNGELAANLHCENPRKDIAALRDGRMRIVTDHQHFNRSYVAVNGMSLAGVNSHVLLHGRYKPKDLDRYKTCIPYLVNISGRHEEAVKHILSILKSNPVDPEQLALLHNIHKKSVTSHLSRGYIILQANKEEKTITLCEKADYFDDMRRPLWFVYSGMGSQWAGMGAQLMHIPIFAAAIQRCQQALEPKGLDIVNIITSADESIFDNILNSFVGIAATQIGLTDILRELGLKPDGIIGHSVGELGCAYADGCLTTEEMILSAYYRGLVSLETKFIHGSMAAVGMGYAQISKLCPPEIEVACHNGPESSTISGPSNVMREFVAELTAKGIFAKVVPCSNIAYHSRYIADGGPGLLRYLKEVISTPKPRSERWLSTSVPIDSWDEPIAKFCSAEYLTNNLLSSVLFEETSRLVPNNAVLVEIAPHGLLQAILKRSMSASCKNVPLTRRKHPDNTFLLEALGKLYMEGYNTNLQVLYPKVEMPVSTGTPFLSHFVKWAHDENWSGQSTSLDKILEKNVQSEVVGVVLQSLQDDADNFKVEYVIFYKDKSESSTALHRSANRKTAADCDFILSLHDKEHAYLRGHSIRGKTVYPFAASLTLVWDTLAMLMGVPRKELSVEFSNIQFYAQPILHDQRQLKLSVSIQRGEGSFEILDGKSKVVTGFITPLYAKISQNVDWNTESLNMHYTADDIYKLLRDRDYFYSGEFRSIECMDESLSCAMLVWRDNWVTFLDGMLQLNALRQQHHAVSQPTSIRVLRIEVKAHKNYVSHPSLKSDSKVLLEAKVSDQSDSTRCGGVLMETVQFRHLPQVVTKMSLKALKFVPYFKSALEVSSSLEVYLQIVAENLNKNILKVVGIQTKAKELSIFKEIRTTLYNVFGIKVDYEEITPELATNNYKFENVDVILVQNLTTDENVYQRLKEVLHHDQFVVIEENSACPDRVRFSSVYRLLSMHNLIDSKSNQQSVLQLVRWGPATKLTNMTTVSIRKESDFEFLTLNNANLASGQSLVVISCYPSPPGLNNLVSILRNQSVRNKIYMVTIENTRESDIEKHLRFLQLANNYVNDGEWGGEFYLPVTESTKASKNVTLQSVQFGENKTLEWVQASELTGPGVTVNVHYVGINTNDMKNANSCLCTQNVNNSYGMDFSGITESGQPVMGLVRSGAASTEVRAQSELLWPVPAHWSLEDAATVPLAYVQAFYCLGIKVGLLPGQSVLVYGGAGALGQAIISIALAHDCEVFTTVSDTHKKYFLLKLFPSLKADHIGYSRDCAFIDTVRMALKSRKCDIIISCAKGAFKDMAIKCTAFGGIFLDVSLIQNREYYNYGMFNLSAGKNYYPIDFSLLLETANMDNIKAIHKMISEGIARGYVRPLTRITYAPQEVPRAFQLLAASQHRGRVLLRMKENNMLAQFRLKCNAHHFYLIVCNKSTFGLQLADRLIARGVKQLFLHVPKQSAYLQHKIRSWKRCHVNVVVSSENVNSQKNIASLLNTVTNLGPLEGVFVTFGAKEIQTNLISYLDLEIKRLCPGVRHFAVINIGVNSIGKNACLNRLYHQLPWTMIELPELKDDSNISSHGAVDATEHALESRRGVFLAHMKREHKPSMLQQIATLTELSIPENASRSLTLGELGIQKHKLKSLCSFLQLHYNLAFEEEQVPSLTINTIKKAEKQITDITFDDKKGLSTFFSYIGSDELLATVESVFLSTLTTNASTRDGEFQSDQMNLCIIPGIEGLHERFRVLCMRLKLLAVVLQPGLDHPHETVRETAERFVEVLVKRIGIQGTFYLMGYETGVFVALEIATILEDRGLTGKVFCVGCAPNELKNELTEQLKAFEDEKQLEDGVLCHMYTLMTGDDSKVLEHELRHLKILSQKLEVCVRTLLGRVPHSIQYVRALLESALARIKIARSHSMPARSLRSQVVLLRAARGRPTLQYTALHHLSQQPVVVHELDSTLGKIATDLRCAAIINEHLDPAILEKFAAKNICNTYLLSARSFIDLE